MWVNRGMTSCVVIHPNRKATKTYDPESGLDIFLEKKDHSHPA